ncbi:hypothetical protein FB451DRAFT_1402525 [Mycena latifolia]|nr:hypothetical protein FB451DRAFT_1402525 [Mycena latifolia]
MYWPDISRREFGSKSGVRTLLDAPGITGLRDDGKLLRQNLLARILRPRAFFQHLKHAQPRSALPDCDTLPSAHARYQAHTISRTRASRLLPPSPPRFVHRDYLARNRASHNPPISPPADACTDERAGYNLAVPSSSFSHSASSPASTAAPSSHDCTQDRTLIRRSLPLFTPKTRRFRVPSPFADAARARENQVSPGIACRPSF